MSARLVDVLLEDVGSRATQQLGLLLEVAVRDASFDVDPAVRSVVRDLRAWSLASKVFRNTPVGVPALALAGSRGAPCADDVVDIAEAARRTGLSTGLLRRHARRGQHGASRGPGGAWRLDASAVDVLAARVRAESLRGGKA